ncbi:hypothetical protein ACFL0Y_01490 [Patescibacteria group bacterium]
MVKSKTKTVFGRGPRPKESQSILTSIKKTLVYADIFDYPLDSSEMHRFLISKLQIPNSKLKKFIKKALPNVSEKRGFYFLEGREKIVSIRKNRKKWSREKMVIVRRVEKWLRLIPWIKMVAVTGALAMNNASQDDDIDLLIVSEKNRLWLTRFFSVFLVEIVAKRRHPGDQRVNNKICLNMFLSEDYLSIPEKERDLFTAHEVVQLKPVMDKKKTYRKFIKANQWIKKFLPNWEPANNSFQEKANSQSKIYFKLGVLDSLESLVRRFQLGYMAQRKTSEITDPGRILFHPQDVRGLILKKYQTRLKKLRLKMVK